MRYHHRVLTLTTLFCCSFCPAQVQERSIEQGIRDQRRAQIQREFMDQLNRSVLRKHEAMLTDTLDGLGALESEAATLLGRLETLRTDAQGIRLTTNLDAVRGIAELMDKPIVNMATLRAHSTSMREELASTRKLIDEPQVGFVPDERKQQDVLLTQDWAQRHLAIVRERSSWLDSVTRAAPQDPGLGSAASLEEAMQEYRAEAVAMLSRLREKARGEVKAEAEEQIVQAARLVELERSKATAEQLLREAREDMERARIGFDGEMKRLKSAAQTEWTQREIEYRATIADLEGKLLLANAEQQKKQTQNEIDVQRIERERQRLSLRERCNEAGVQAALAPFLAKGYTQPGSNSPGVALQPISFSKLRSCGALEPGPQGVSRLIRVAVWKGDTERPRWPYPENVSAVEKRFKGGLARVTEAQQLLIELGDTLVELEMLAP
jgi:hypothetical protein